jgi:hypothetical protein
MFALQTAIDWGALIQPVLETLLQLLLPVVLGLVGVWVKRLSDKVKAELSSEQLAFLTAIAQQLVVAAEQSGLIGAIEDAGEAKKQMVLAQLQQIADEKGIKINVEALSAIIEAAVVAEFGFSFKEEPA